MRILHVILLVSIGVGVCAAFNIPLETGKRLIKTNENQPARWMTQEEIWKTLIRPHANFIDITDHQDVEGNQTEVGDTSVIPTTIRYPNETREILLEINDARVESFIKTFSTYYTRYYTADSGVKSSEWLLAQVQESIQGYDGNVSVNKFQHTWPQCSIIARIEGSDPDLKSQVVILGAHQDSINLFGSRLRAPGADDNAAGSVVVLEALRAIMSANFRPKRSLEFQWYAAEEVGLRGSAAIAQAYYYEKVNVVGMFNFDVPGYDNGKKEIGIYTDNADPTLTSFVRLLVEEYLDYGWVDDKCGYGCSDHASFTRYGYASAMPAESTLHPLMHTPYDNAANVGYIQVREFVKLALGACVEFGEPADNDLIDQSEQI